MCAHTRRTAEHATHVRDGEPVCARCAEIIDRIAARAKDDSLEGDFFDILEDSVLAASAA